MCPLLQRCHAWTLLRHLQLLLLLLRGDGGAAERDADDWGGYSLLQLTLDKYWETGIRFDWWDADHLGDEWGVTTFLSYFFSHSMYLRPAYRYNRFSDGSGEHQALVQFVWGLGPHAHRLED